MTAKPPNLDAEARRRLVGLARAVLEGGRPIDLVGRVEEEMPDLAAPGAAFVTLRRRGSGELRGCCGQIAPVGSLARSVASMALASARDDPRFPVVRPSELESIEIDITVLGPLVGVRPEEIEVGRHGLLITRGSRRGLLLPQVAPEHGWDRQDLLEALCRKAGLERGAWRQARTDLSAFEAISWSEREVAREIGSS